MHFGCGAEVRAGCALLLRINVCLIGSVAMAPFCSGHFAPRVEHVDRTAGESSERARAMGYSVLGSLPGHHGRRTFSAGLGGSFLSTVRPRKLD